jgi:hypothetical protein
MDPTAPSTSPEGSLTNDHSINSTPNSLDDERKKTASPAVAMAAASLLSQKAALQEQDNFDKILQLQKENLELRKEEARNSLAKSTTAGSSEQ